MAIASLANMVTSLLVNFVDIMSAKFYIISLTKIATRNSCADVKTLLLLYFMIRKLYRNYCHLCRGHLVIVKDKITTAICQW